MNTPIQDPNRLPVLGARTTPRKGKSPNPARAPANTIDNYFNARDAPGSDGKPGAASPAPALNPSLPSGKAARPATVGWGAPCVAQRVASTTCQTVETAALRAQQEAAAERERARLEDEAAAALCALPRPGVCSHCGARKCAYCKVMALAITRASGCTFKRGMQ